MMRTRLQWSMLVGAVVVALTIVGGAVPRTRAARTAEERVERGRYLVAITACGDCHTPLKDGPNGPEPDPSRLLSGHPESFKMTTPPAPVGTWLWSGAPTNTAFAGPWGISYAANLTPDRNTGLGAWTQEMFVAAIRTGHHMGISRPIAPPMPWEAYRTATDEDLNSIYAYLRTIEPVVNHVPDYVPPGATTH
jgi:mono/diheme cytochrome c family protein